MCIPMFICDAPADIGVDVVVACFSSLLYTICISIAAGKTLLRTDCFVHETFLFSNRSSIVDVDVAVTQDL